jgi:hypothetical protein
MPGRPTGITILAILAGLCGIVLIIGGVVVGAMAGAITDFIETYASSISVGVDITGFIEAALIAIAAIAFIIGILHVLVAYGFWIGAGWSRWLAIILMILYIILGLVTIPGGIITIIIAGLILWYLMQPSVKAFFGAAPPPTPPPAPPPA